MKHFNLIMGILSILYFGCQSDPGMLELINYQSIDSSLSFRGIYAVDEQIAWVSGSRGSVYRTANGGVDWEKIMVSDSSELDFRDIEILSDNAIILMSAGPGGLSRIYRSSDNGNTWKISYINKHPTGFLNSIAFWNKENGIAVGDPIDGYLFVLLTNDGGISWEEMDAQKLPMALDGECGFAASGSCVSTYGNNFAWIATGGPAARVFKTSDRGENWTVSDTPILSGNSSSGIFAVYFSDPGNGYIAGGDYTNPDLSTRTMAYTLNGGIDWKLVKKNSPVFQSDIACYKSAKSDHLISVGPNGIYLTKNSLDWTRVSDLGFHCVSISQTDNSIWAAGANGRIAKLAGN